MINTKYSVVLTNYQDLHSWSVRNYSSFWTEVWTWTGLVGSPGPGPACHSSAPIQSIPRWFEGSQINYAENLLRFVLLIELMWSSGEVTQKYDYYEKE